MWARAAWAALAIIVVCCCAPRDEFKAVRQIQPIGPGFVVATDRTAIGDDHSKIELLSGSDFDAWDRPKRWLTFNRDGLERNFSTWIGGKILPQAACLACCQNRRSNERMGFIREYRRLWVTLSVVENEAESGELDYSGQLPVVGHAVFNEELAGLRVRSSRADTENENPRSLQFAEGFFGNFRLASASVSSIPRGLCRGLGVIHSNPHVAELPVEQAKLERPDNHKPESEKASSIFRKPWFFWLSVAGLFGSGGWYFFWLTLRPIDKR